MGMVISFIGGMFLLGVACCIGEVAINIACAASSALWAKVSGAAEPKAAKGRQAKGCEIFAR